MNSKDNEKLIEDMFNKGVLISEDLLKEEIDSSVINKIEHEKDLIVLNNDYVEVISQQTSLVDWYEVDKYRVEAEKERDDDLYQSHLQSFKKSNLLLKTPESSQKQELSSLEAEVEVKGEASFTVPSASVSEENSQESQILASQLSNNDEIFSQNNIEIIISFENKPHKYEVKDFTQLFMSRFHFLESLLRNRQEMQNVMSINRLLSKKEKENVSLIGLVEEIGETKNGNLIITIEDPTGRIKILISKNKKEIFEQAKDLIFDEVVGISGVLGDKIIFVEEIIWPDVPSSNQLKKGEKEEYIIFLSDIHLGSKYFMEEEFNKFLQWINGKVGNEKQRNTAKKVKYVVIAGDLVDGVGIYPSQKEELNIQDIIEQYNGIYYLLKKIPSDKEIIICPGNHDAVHLAEPQTSFDEKFAAKLFNLPNLTLVTNPAVVNVGKTKTFSGFNILLYHGFSFDFYVNNVESIRNNGGYHRADLIMKFLLKKRHLAPAYKSTPYFPAHREDPLLIRKIPDFFISGHIHYSKIANYRGITMISGSCWQGKTTFQEKLGHEPEPARVPIVNLKTREIQILKF